jgi:uncharacterized RDD family membrane protein YckC
VYPDRPVVTGEAVALDIRLAGIGSRGIATLIDLAIEFALLFILLIGTAVLEAFTTTDAADAVALVIFVGVLLGYPVGLETLWRGQTVGKKVMGLRVVRDDGGPIRFRHALVRGLAGVVFEKPMLVMLPALASMSISSRHKRFGDLMAGTVVLQQRAPGQIDAQIHMPPQLAGWAAGLDLSGVDDRFALRIRQFVTRAHELNDASRATLEHQLCTEIGQRVTSPPPGTPPWALLTAVLAERRRRAFIHAAPPTRDAAPPGPGPAQPASVRGAPGPQNPASAASPATPPLPESTTGFVAPS